MPWFPPDDFIILWILLGAAGGTMKKCCLLFFSRLTPKFRLKVRFRFGSGFRIILELHLELDFD